MLTLFTVNHKDLCLCRSIFLAYYFTAETNKLPTPNAFATLPLSLSVFHTTNLCPVTHHVMMMHELIYFNAPGRAETIRICLHIANAQWTDTRIEGKNWPTLKATSPLGSVPLLKISSDDDDDSSAASFTHCQSIALARYAAKLAGLYPDDPIQALYVDEVMETLNEMMSSAPKKADGMSDDDFQKARTDFQSTTMTKVATFLESIIQSNGGGTSVAKNQASVADLMVQGTVNMIEMGWWDHIDKDFFMAYPGIRATADTISKHEGVVSYHEMIKK